MSAVRSVEFGVTDLDRSLEFYQQVWSLDLVDRDGRRAFLRGSGSEHHIVVLREHQEPGLLRATFAATTQSDVDTLRARIAALGLWNSGAPAAIASPGGGYGFAFHDRAGREFAITTGVAMQTPATAAENRPVKVSHLVLNAADAAADTAFFCDVLGFRLRDQTARMNFLGCNADHHSVALVRGGGVSLNHVAFEVPDLDSLMRGSARVRRAGHDIEWGIGRHGPGNNIFAYFCDPDDIAIEYTAQIEQVDDATYRPRTAEHWRPPIAGNSDYWGFAAPPSERFKRASESTHRAAPAASSNEEVAQHDVRHVDVLLRGNEERLEHRTR